jgi:hypothetical protein
MMRESAMERIQPGTQPRVARRTARFDSVVLTEIVYPARFNINWHSHAIAAFALTLRDSSTLAFTNTRFDHTENGMIVRPAGALHRDNYSEQGAMCFLIEMNSEWIESLPQFRPVLERPAFTQRER